MRIAILRDPAIAAGIGQFAVIQAMAPQSFRAELSPIDVRDGGEIERDIAAFAREPNGGLIVTASTPISVHRELIIMLAARHRLPAVYPFHDFVTSGGLMSYGPDLTDPFRQAATSTASSKARRRPTCQCRHRPSTNWRSISRPRRRSVSPCHRRCSHEPIR